MVAHHFLAWWPTGGFASEDEAARAYDRAAIVYYGTSTQLNVSGLSGLGHLVQLHLRPCKVPYLRGAWAKGAIKNVAALRYKGFFASMHANTVCFGQGHV